MPDSNRRLRLMKPTRIHLLQPALQKFSNPENWRWEQELNLRHGSNPVSYLRRSHQTKLARSVYTTTLLWFSRPVFSINYRHKNKMRRQHPRRGKRMCHEANSEWNRAFSNRTGILLTPQTLDRKPDFSITWSHVPGLHLIPCGEIPAETNAIRAFYSTV